MKTPKELPLPMTTCLSVQVGVFYYNFTTVPQSYVSMIRHVHIFQQQNQLLPGQQFLSGDDFTVYSSTHPSWVSVGYSWWYLLSRETRAALCGLLAAQIPRDFHTGNLGRKQA